MFSSVNIDFSEFIEVKISVLMIVPQYESSFECNTRLQVNVLVAMWNRIVLRLCVSRPRPRSLIEGEGQSDRLTITLEFIIDAVYVNNTAA